MKTPRGLNWLMHADDSGAADKIVSGTLGIDTRGGPRDGPVHVIHPNGRTPHGRGRHIRWIRPRRTLLSYPWLLEQNTTPVE